MTKSLEDHFLAIHNSLPQNGATGPLVDLSKEAIAQFAEIGFPKRKSESWKYTNITPIISRNYQIAEKNQAPAKGIPVLNAHVAVFVNGRFAPEQSKLDQLPEGVEVASLRNVAGNDYVQAHLGQYADYKEDSFASLNTAFLRDGCVINVASGVTLDRPIHVIHVIMNNQASLIQPRSLIHVSNGGSVQVLQSTEFAGTASVLMNSVTEVYVDREAHVDYLDIQVGTSQSSRISNLSIYQESHSKFYSGVFTFGGELVRNNLSILPNAEYCESILHGLFMARKNSHIDNSTLVDHAKPNCYSSEYYKGILDDHATGVFNGKVHVREDAQLTNAYQTNRSILLTETARMYSKPALEIYADDVKCSHGATTGQLDKDGLFYLRSRGIPEQDARRLMLSSFAGDIIEKTPFKPLHELLYDQVEHMLS